MQNTQPKPKPTLPTTLTLLLIFLTTNPQADPIHDAVRDANHQQLQQLLNQGINPNTPDPDNQNNTPLHYATENNTTQIIQTLLNHPHINPNTPNKHGQTPLHYAVSADPLFIQHLLNHPKTNPNPQDNHGNTPLHYATLYPTFETSYLNATPLLLNHGANPNIQNNNLQTPLLYHYYYILKEYSEMHILYNPGAEQHKTIDLIQTAANNNPHLHTRHNPTTNQLIITWDTLNHQPQQAPTPNGPWQNIQPDTNPNPILGQGQITINLNNPTNTKPKFLRLQPKP